MILEACSECSVIGVDRDPEALTEARTELAVKYDYKSPLENHHKDVTFSILGQPETNIFSQCSRSEVEQIKSVRESA